MDSLIVDRILAKLQGVRQSGIGWTALCPAHEDRQNSLSLTVADDGKVLLKCFAGCEAEAVVQVVGLKMRDLFPADGRSRRGPQPAREPLTVAGLAADKGLPENFLREQGVQECAAGVRITYRFEDNGLAARQRIRTAVKAKDGSRWEKGQGSLVPYGLWRLPEMVKAGYLILVEGESDSWTLWHQGFSALGIPGADMSKTLTADHVRAFQKLFILREPDRGGESFARGIRRRLRSFGWTGEAFEVRLSGVKDPNELFKRDPDAFRSAFQAALDAAEPLRQEAPDRSVRSEAPRAPSQSTRLIELAATMELFHSGEDCYATIPVGDHNENHRLSGLGFRRWLSRVYYEQEGKAPNAQAIADALLALQGKARFEGKERAIAVRLAAYEGVFYLDLGRESWQGVEITPQGWKIVPIPLVKFLRPRGLQPLPEPVRGGGLAELRTFVNVEDSDWSLILGWLVAAFKPTGPYPILVLHGEQGSAKSTTARVLRALVDPVSAPLRCEPRDQRDLMIAALNAWLLSFDNLSRLPAWLSDALCRLSTGGGFATRELYSDAEEVVFDAQRPIILNGIEELATRGDLLDRAILVSLPVIPETQRRTEAEFWAGFDAVRARVLGALLDAVSSAMRNLPAVSLKRFPRMADFARWAVAAEPALGMEDGAFMAAYNKNRWDANALTLENSPLILPLLAVVNAEGVWQGTAEDLLRALNGIADEELKHQDGWPKSGARLSNRLKRIAPNLRAEGWDVGFKVPGLRRGIRIEKVGKTASDASIASRPTGTGGTMDDDVSSVERPASSEADPKRANITHDSPIADGLDAMDDPLRHISGEARAPLEPEPVFFKDHLARDPGLAAEVKRMVGGKGDQA